MDDAQQLEELRMRLDRRNQLLAIVRKAYHRDIIVVREYLLHLQNGVKIDEIKPEDLDLRTIPSIDLRNEGLHLFAPQECELTLTPCFHCGGRLEVTHRESSRFNVLMECCDRLKAREKHLDDKLVDAIEQIDDGQIAMLKQEAELMEEQHRLHAEIDWLKQCVADRNALERLSNAQKSEIEALNITRREKEQLEETLADTKSELFQRGKDCLEAQEAIAKEKDSNADLQKRCEEGRHRERGLINRVEQMSYSNDDLKNIISTLEELEIQLKGEINTCKAEMRRYVAPQYLPRYAQHRHRRL